VRAAAQARSRDPTAPTRDVERLRRALLDADDLESATLVSLMADAGLRPGEATALAWEHVGARTLLVEQASSGDGGAAKGTKTGAIRTVRLLAALVDDLAAWRSRSARDGGPLFPRRDGTAWTMTDYRNWRRRRFDPAAETAGLVGVRPYDLRHSFASLMIQSGYSPVELAAELGHAPTLTLNTYAHVFSEFARGERVDPERLIEQVRASS